MNRLASLRSRSYSVCVRLRDLKKLKGSKNEYRLRVGNYRVLFELEGKRIVVYTVGPRKDIYQ